MNVRKKFSSIMLTFSNSMDNNTELRYYSSKAKIKKKNEGEEDEEKESKIAKRRIGAGIAVAGAFSLVRFRSAPGTAKEIVIIFISTAAGLALGMGYIAYAVVFMALSGLSLFLLTKFSIFEKKNADCDKLLKITIPESLDYENVFGDLFVKYTKECKLVQVKSVNMGSMFKLTYAITLNTIQEEKEFIDELRVRNGNLEISLVRQDFTNEL